MAAFRRYALTVDAQTLIRIPRETAMKHRLWYWLAAAALGTLPIFALAFLAGKTAAAGPWYVSTTSSDSNDCQTALTPCATINAALGKAGPGDTINVAEGSYAANSGAEVVLITQSVTLLGGWT